jgi:photosystem II stability/assembly factor-like uncharacterized protein
MQHVDGAAMRLIQYLERRGGLVRNLRTIVQSPMRTSGARYLGICLLCMLPLCAQSQSLEWTETSGIAGSEINAVKASGDSLVLAGTWRNGLYLSTDAGTRWKNVGFQNRTWGVYSVEFGGPDTFFAGVSSIGPASERGVFRSTNRGGSWEMIHPEVLQFPVSPIYSAQRILRTRRELLIADKDIFRSTDGGDTWTRITMPNTVNALARSSDGSIYAAGNGVYRSTNGGSDWSVASGTLRFVESLCIDSTGLLYAQTLDTRHLYSSSNEGATWDTLRPYTGPFRSCVKSIIITPSAELLVCQLVDYTRSSSQVLYGTTNHGLSWTQKASIAANSLCFSERGILYAGLGRHLYGSNDPGYGLERSDDEGRSWKRIGIYDAVISAVGCLSENTILAGTRDHGLFRSTNAGVFWSEVREAVLTNKILSCFAFASDGASFAGASNGGVFCTNPTGSGVEWRETGLEGYAVTALAVDKADMIYAGTWGYGVFRSTDKGRTWISIGTPDEVITDLNITPSQDLIVATEMEGIFRLDMSNSNWSRIGPPMGNLTCADYLDGVVYAGDEYGNVHHVDGEGSTNSIMNITAVPITDIHCAPDGAVAAVDEAGNVFLSTDEGETWSRTHIGGQLNCITSFKGDTWFLGTLWQGLLRAKNQNIPGLAAGLTDGMTRPEYTRLFQNYPNPFNANTVITYQLAGAADTRMSVFDMLGREVAVLVDERKAAGVYRATFDASGLASGVYVCRLQSGAALEAKKVLLMR